jgi:hypothetical protein
MELVIAGQPAANCRISINYCQLLGVVTVSMFKDTPNIELPPAMAAQLAGSTTHLDPDTTYSIDLYTIVAAALLS